jgi:hypothetical protein
MGNRDNYTSCLYKELLVLIQCSVFGNKLLLMPLMLYSEPDGQ